MAKGFQTLQIKGKNVRSIREWKDYVEEFEDNCLGKYKAIKELHYLVLQALLDEYDDVSDSIAMGYNNYSLVFTRDTVIVMEKVS